MALACQHEEIRGDLTEAAFCPGGPGRFFGPTISNLIPDRFQEYGTISSPDWITQLSGIAYGKLYIPLQMAFRRSPQVRSRLAPPSTFSLK